MQNKGSVEIYYTMTMHFCLSMFGTKLYKKLHKK